MLESYARVLPGEIAAPHFSGCGAQYNGFSFMPQSEEAGLTGDVLTREFDRVERMRLPIARTWFRPDFNTDRMRRFNQWLEKTRELHVQVAVNAGQWFTRDVWYFAHEKFNDPAFTSDPANFALCCAKFALWISKALEYWIEVKHYDHIRYLFLFAEPLTARTGALPAKMTQEQAYELCCRKVHEQLQTLGIRDKVRLVGPNSLYVGGNAEPLKFAVDRLNDVFDIYSAHTYARCAGEYADLGYAQWLEQTRAMKKLTARTGKPFWIDEYGLSGRMEQAEQARSSPRYGNFLAQANAAFLNARADASLLFELFDQKTFWSITNEDSYHNGVHRWGLAYMPGDDVPEPDNVRPAWYAFALLSRYMTGDTQILETQTGDGICAAAVRGAEGLSLLLVNRTGEPVNVAVDAGTFPLRRSLYDPAAVHPTPDARMPEPDETTSDSRFTTLLPPYGVAVYHA